MGHRWDIGGTLVKPTTVSSDMYLPGDSITAVYEWKVGYRCSINNIVTNVVNSLFLLLVCA